jgi:hypothetical protein
MTIRLSRSTIALSALAFLLLLLAPDPAYGQRRGGSQRSSFYYSSPSKILRGQLALESKGHLERGKYEPGRYDPPTREAIRDFQRRHRLWSNGRLDRDTFAMLPIDDRPDDDDDGIPDPDDRCPDTKKGARVDFDGCPLDKEKETDKSKD